MQDEFRRRVLGKQSTSETDAQKLIQSMNELFTRADTLLRDIELVLQQCEEFLDEQ